VIRCNCTRQLYAPHFPARVRLDGTTGASSARWPPRL